MGSALIQRRGDPAPNYRIPEATVVTIVLSIGNGISIASIFTAINPIFLVVSTGCYSGRECKGEEDGFVLLHEFKIEDNSRRIAHISYDILPAPHYSV
jgi:hypothetical protein